MWNEDNRLVIVNNRQILQAANAKSHCFGFEKSTLVEVEFVPSQIAG